jgi:hypothetical protein
MLLPSTVFLSLGRWIYDQSEKFPGREKYHLSGSFLSPNFEQLSEASAAAQRDTALPPGHPFVQPFLRVAY